MRWLAALATVATIMCTASAQELDLLFPSQPRELRLRLSIETVAAKPQDRWQAFIDAFFNFLDRDGNGSLSEREANRAFAIPLPEGGAVKMDFAKLDANQDGGASRAEFAAFYREAGFGAVAVKFVPPPAERLRLGNALFHQFDRNGDGKLTGPEMGAVQSLLRRLDDNEDEVLAPSELLLKSLSTTAPTVEDRVQIRPPQRENRPAGSLRLVLAKEVSAKIDPVAQPTVVTSEPSPIGKALAFRFPGGTCSLASTIEDRAASFKATRRFYAAQFKNALGGRPAISRQDLERDPSFRLFASIFEAADRDGNGKLTEAEMTAYLDLIELGVGCQITLMIEDRGGNLFDLLDADENDQLDWAELQCASQLLEVDGVKKEFLTPATLPRLYRMHVLRGVASNAFGPVTIAGAVKPVHAKAPVAAGPAWFRAMDRNGDGFISLREFLGPAELFHRLDANGDGRISIEEAAKAKP